MKTNKLRVRSSNSIVQSILLSTLTIVVGIAAVAVADRQAKSDPEAEPAASCASEVAARVQSYYDAVTDLHARFRQVTRSVTLGNASLGDDAPSQGDVQLAKPGKMRWSYESPSPSLVVSDGETLWIFDPVAQEVQRMPVSEGFLVGAALEFMLGDGKLVEAFEIRGIRCEKDASGVVVLELVPRELASYERMQIGVRSDTGAIVDTRLVDLFGNQTEIFFEDMKTNLALPASRFVFEVPEGVEIIDLQLPQ